MGDLVTWQSLKLMFDPLYDDSIWRDMPKYKVRKWKLFQGCGVHVLEVGPYTLYMLAEKDYPLSNCKEILYQMLKGKIQLQLQQVYWVDNQAFELLKKYKDILQLKESSEIVIWKNPPSAE